MHGIDYFCRLYKLNGKELAILLGCKQQQITTWKNGNRDIPKHHLYNLCDIFNVPDDKVYLLKKIYLSEIDRSEIEILLNKAKLKNFEQNIDDSEEDDKDLKGINDALRYTLHSNIRMLEQDIEAIKLANRLKSVLCKNFFDTEKFSEQCKKAEQFIQELERQGKS